MKNEDVSKVLNDVQDMKGRQDEMTMKLDQIKRWETLQLFTVQLCYVYKFLPIQLSKTFGMINNCTEIIIY